MKKSIIILIILLTLLVMSCAKKVDYSFLQNYDKDTYKEANAIVIIDSTGVDLQPSGQYVSTHHKLIKILTMKGKAMFSEAQFGYYSKYDTIIVEEARVIKPDGTIIEISQDDIKDIKFPAFGKFFLPNVKIKKIIFPNIVEGASIEYVINDIMKSPPMEDNFDAAIQLETEQPIIKKTFTINSPMKLDWIVKNDPEGRIKFQKKDISGKTLYKWTIRNGAGIIKEPLMPPVMDIAKKVLVSSVPTWKEFSRWYYNICKDKFITDAEMDKVIDSLLVDKKSREDSIRALYFYVSQNIRYVATEMTGKKGGYEPFPAPKTFKDKYGVCRDKATLLVAMLKKAGFDSYIVLINPFLDIDKEIPVDLFNHAITAVKNEKGDYLYIDATAENTSEFLTSIEQNKAILVCTPEGEELSFTPPSKPEENLFKISAVGSLDEEGNLKEKAEIKTTGLMGMAFRQILTKLPPKVIKDIFQQMINQYSPKAEIDTFYYSDPEDLYNPLVLSLEFEADDYALKIDDSFSFKLPFSSSGTSTALSSIGTQMNPFALEKREYPIDFMTTFMTEVHAEMDIPEGYKIIDTPSDIDQEMNFFSVKGNYKKENGTLIYDIIAKFHKPKLSPENYKKMKEFIDKMVEESDKDVIIVKEGA